MGSGDAVDVGGNGGGGGGVWAGVAGGCGAVGAAAFLLHLVCCWTSPCP